MGSPMPLHKPCAMGEQNRNLVKHTGVETDQMPRIATEQIAIGVVRVRRRQMPERVRFCALDGAVRVVIEADSEDDARHLCREMRWEFIGLCHG
jgi:hypothetical protein